MKKSRKSFDFDKFLDNVFLHGKNADERLFDLILRSITFIVILLFVFLFSTLKVHADTLDLKAYILGSNEYNLSGWFFNDDYYRMSQTFSDIPYNSAYQLPNVSWKNIKVTSNMDFDNFQFVIGCNYGSGGYESIFLIFIPKDVQVAMLDSQRLYFMDDCECPYVWTDFGHQNDTSYYSYRSTTFSAGLANFSSSNTLSSGALTFFFGNIPYLKGSNVDAPTYFENGNDLYTCYNANFYMYDGLAKLPTTEEVESSKNHLALSDVQIGLSSFDKEMTDLSESSVVIGVGVDDNWILSHMNDYTVGISYHFYIKDSNMNQADPISMYDQTIPLSYFKDAPVTYGVANLMSSSMIAPFPSNRDFYSYYRSLSSSYGQKVVTREHRDGFFPSVLKSIYRFTIGGYNIDNPVTTNNTIFEFYLDVKVRLMAEGESGGYYTKRFDFKRGTVSILGADAFQNPNPWEGPTSPESEYDPNVPSGSTGSSSGGGASAVAYGGNVNVVINNNNKLGDLVGDDDDSPSSTISEYLSAIDEMKGSIETLTNEDDEEITSSKSFNQFLKDNLETFPGMNLMISVIKIVVGICLIIIAIKLLLAIF